MKKLFIASAIAMFGLVSAQKGTVLVGGNISLGNTIEKAGGTTVSKGNTFEFNPRVGYQFADNWTAGVRLGIGTDKTTQSPNEIKNNSFSYGVFGRYTMPLNETFAVFGELDVYAANGKRTTTISNVSSTSKTTGFGMVFTPNLFINFKKSFGLNFNVGGLGYTSEKVKGTDSKTNSFGFDFGKGVTFGISKNF